ncbi:hypothetical protein C5964_03140 [Cronobacter sakazakii]|nr:hypothetical protein C5964_03140 [Cronobacter sakazakii]
MLSLLRLAGGGDGLRNQAGKSDFRESIKKGKEALRNIFGRARVYSGEEMVHPGGLFGFASP